MHFSSDAAGQRLELAPEALGAFGDRTGSSRTTDRNVSHSMHSSKYLA